MAHPRSISIATKRKSSNKKLPTGSINGIKMVRCKTGKTTLKELGSKLRTIFPIRRTLNRKAVGNHNTPLGSPKINAPFLQHHQPQTPVALSITLNQHSNLKQLGIPKGLGLRRVHGIRQARFRNNLYKTVSPSTVSRMLGHRATIQSLQRLITRAQVILPRPTRATHTRVRRRQCKVAITLIPPPHKPITISPTMATLNPLTETPAEIGCVETTTESHVPLATFFAYPIDEVDRADHFGGGQIDDQQLSAGTTCGNRVTIS